MKKDTNFVLNPILNSNKIFAKNINNKYKLVGFNFLKNNVGETKYFPSDFKEWNNNIYYFNSNNIKNFPIYDLNISKLIRNYFDLYLNQNKIKSTSIPFRKRRLSLNKIFISKPEIKHTNNKAIITIYTYNREKIVLLKKLIHLKESLLWINEFFFKYKNIYMNIYNKVFKDILYKQLIYIRKHKLKFNLNELKFQEIFLYKLSKLISKFYNKKVEINIINLKSITYHPSIFTEIIKIKLKNRYVNISRVMDKILSQGIILKENTIKKKSRLIKSVNFNLLENRYKNFNLNSIINGTNLEKLIKDLYSTENSDSKSIILDSIKYKNLGGIRLEAKGRLTKRYRADRASFKAKWKGGLKNIDSSYKGLSSVNFRGNINPNMEYSMGVSKRRIGAFAVRGWISGKK